MVVRTRSKGQALDRSSFAGESNGSLDAIPDYVVAGQTDTVTPAEVASYLAELIGPSITALIAGTSDPSEVARWMRGESLPAQDAERRLRAAFAAARLVASAESAAAARAWLLGRSPYLGDRSPARVITDDGEQGAADALGAARAYLVHG